MSDVGAGRKKVETAQVVKPAATDATLRPPHEIGQSAEDYVAMIDSVLVSLHDQMLRDRRSSINVTAPDKGR